MTILTDLVAAVVVHSSAAAFSHFGMALEAPEVQRPQPAAERVIARTPQRKPTKLSECPPSATPRREAAGDLKA
jgi:hypothetical protein